MLTFLTVFVAAYWVVILLVFFVAAAVVLRLFVRSMRVAAHLALSDMPPPALDRPSPPRER
jgi:hypothetical protein